MYEKAQRMYILQASVPSLLQCIMTWKSFASAGKFAVVEYRLSGRALGLIYCEIVPSLRSPFSLPTYHILESQ